MRDRNVDDISDVHQRQPRRAVRHDARADDTGLVAGDGIVGQGRAALVGVDNLAVRHESELDECLKTVAYAAHKPASAVEQVGNGIAYLRAAEECGYELTRAVGLVAAREAAGDEYRLRLAYRVRKCLGAEADAVCCAVVYDHDACVCACILDSLCRVVLAVSTREYGDEHGGTHRAYGGCAAFAERA